MESGHNLNGDAKDRSRRNHGKVSGNFESSKKLLRNQETFLRKTAVAMRFWACSDSSSARPSLGALADSMLRHRGLQETRKIMNRRTFGERFVRLALTPILAIGLVAG